MEQFVSLCCGAQRLPDGRVLPPVQLYQAKGDVGKEAARTGHGVEETARVLRYAFLRQAAQQAGANLIATAHTADDNAETILFHLSRGSGLRGLTGIAPRRDDLIRPLLTTTRREIEDYLRYYALPHREDRTNFDDTYARNRIRHQVVPVLEGLFPGFAPRVSDLAARLRADEDYLSDQARAISHRAVKQGEGLSIPAAALAQAPGPLAVRALRQLLDALCSGGLDRLRRPSGVRPGPVPHRVDPRPRSPCPTVSSPDGSMTPWSSPPPLRKRCPSVPCPCPARSGQDPGRWR